MALRKDEDEAVWNMGYLEAPMEADNQKRGRIVGLAKDCNVGSQHALTFACILTVSNAARRRCLVLVLKPGSLTAMPFIVGVGGPKAAKIAGLQR